MVWLGGHDAGASGRARAAGKGEEKEVVGNHAARGGPGEDRLRGGQPPGRMDSGQDGQGTAARALLPQGSPLLDLTQKTACVCVGSGAPVT